MSSGLPVVPREGRIIPFRSPSASTSTSPALDAAPATLAAHAAELRDVRAEAARHYLKFMLPSIPIATFVLSFMYSYLILGVGTRLEHGSQGAALVDATLPLVGAALLALVTGALCMAIYFGFLRICALRRLDLRD